MFSAGDVVRLSNNSEYLSYLGIIAFYMILLTMLYMICGIQENRPYVSLDYGWSALLGISLFSSFGLIIISQINEDRAHTPFVFLYLFLIFFPYILLHQISGYLGFDFKGAILVTLPLLISFFPQFNKTSIMFRIGRFDYRTLGIFLIVLNLSAVVLLLLLAPPSASFSIEEVYIRRLEAREIYVGWKGYFTSIMMNGFLPFSVFWSIRFRNKFLFISASLILLSLFYVFGVKAPFVMFGLAAFVGWIGYRVKFKHFILAILATMLILVLASFVELAVWNYSYVEDYFFRRIHYVVVYNIQTYLQVYFSQGFSDYGLFGMQISLPASFYIGEEILLSPGLNANSNTFMYYLIQYGLPGYLFSVVAVWAILLLFDKVSQENREIRFVALLFSILILEQSFTTTLVSSGILAISGVIFCLKKPQSEYAEDHTGAMI